MKDTTQKILNMVLPWISWGITVLFFCHQYFLRISANSLEPSLLGNYPLDAVVNDKIDMIFYYTYLLASLLSGLLIDRFGARLMLFISALLCGVAAFILSQSNQLWPVALAHIVMGFGASFSLIAVLILARAWFSNAQFLWMNGLTISVAAMAALLGEGPLAHFLMIVNWNEMALVIAVISFALSGAVLLFVHDYPNQQPIPVSRPRLEHRDVLLHHLRTVFCDGYIWLAGVYASLLFIPTLAFAALWCIPYLIMLYGISSKLAVLASSMILFGLGVGAPFMAWVANRVNNRSAVMAMCALAALCDMTLILYYRNLNLSAMFVALMFLGIFSSGYTLAMVVVKESVADEVTATAFGLVSFIKMVGGAVSLWLINHLLSHHWRGDLLDNNASYSISNYQLSLAVIPGCLALALMIAVLLQEPRGRRKNI